MDTNIGGSSPNPTVSYSQPSQIGFNMPTSTDNEPRLNIQGINPSPSSDNSEVPQHIYPNRSRMESGKNSYEEEDDDDDLAFFNKSVRRAFIQKVYGILCSQLFIMTSIILLFSFQKDVRGFVQLNDLYILPIYIVVTILLVVVAIPCMGLRRKFPDNLILLGLFTVTYGLWIGLMATYFESKIVALAGIMTLVITIGLTIFVHQTWIDFTGFRLIVISLSLVIISFLGIYYTLPEFPLESIVIACVVVFILSIFVVLDIQDLVTRDGISQEEYIFGALNIYLDSVMIFCRVLCVCY